MKTIALVPCSSKKKQTKKPIEAKDLYIGPFFKKALECAKSLRPDIIYILSAKHHLVELNQKLSNYDMKLSSKTKDQKEWASIVLRQLEEKGIDLDYDKIFFLTGKKYYENILSEIGNHVIIGEGLPIGLKIQEFNRIINSQNK